MQAFWMSVLFILNKSQRTYIHNINGIYRGYTLLKLSYMSLYDILGISNSINAFKTLKA